MSHYSHYQYGDGQTEWLEDWEAILRKVGDDEVDFITPDWMKNEVQKDTYWAQVLLKKSLETLDNMLRNSFLNNWAADWSAARLFCHG